MLLLLLLVFLFVLFFELIIINNSMLKKLCSPTIRLLGYGVGCFFFILMMIIKIKKER